MISCPAPKLRGKKKLNSNIIFVKEIITFRIKTLFLITTTTVILKTFKFSCIEKKSIIYR